MSSISSTSSYSTIISSSSSTENESIDLSLEISEMTDIDFINKFENDEVLMKDEFQFLGATYGGEIHSFTSIGIGDCITMFGIGKDGSLFAWHSSSGEDNELIGKEKVLEKLNFYFSKYDEHIKNLQFNIYLVGGNGSAFSESLCEGMIAAIPEFFYNATLIDKFINPTKNIRKTFITANFNTNAELHYFFHDRLSSSESSEDFA